MGQNPCCTPVNTKCLAIEEDCNRICIALLLQVYPTAKCVNQFILVFAVCVCCFCCVFLYLFLAGCAVFSGFVVLVMFVYCCLLCFIGLCCFSFLLAVFREGFCYFLAAWLAKDPRTNLRPFGNEASPTNKTTNKNNEQPAEKKKKNEPTRENNEDSNKYKTRTKKSWKRKATLNMKNKMAPLVVLHDHVQIDIRGPCDLPMFGSLETFHFCFFVCLFGFVLMFAFVLVVVLFFSCFACLFVCLLVGLLTVFFKMVFQYGFRC